VAVRFVCFRRSGAATAQMPPKRISNRHIAAGMKSNGQFMVCD
jgi:hypothetical protein